MQHLYPPYYGDFHCIAQRCPDSCCHEWDVQIDPDTARRYHELPGALRTPPGATTNFPALWEKICEMPCTKTPAMSTCETVTAAAPGGSRTGCAGSNVPSGTTL